LAETTELTVKPQLDVGTSGLELRNIDQVIRFANMVAGTTFAPKGMDARQIIVAVTYGMELGLTPHQSLQSIAVINGRPTLYGDAPLGLVKGANLLDDMSEVFEGTGDNLTAVCTITRKGQATPHVARFSVGDAKSAQLWGKSGPWSQYPRRMLQMRARGFALRDAFPDVLKGLVTEDEARDTPTVSHVRKPGQSASVSLAESLTPEPMPETIEPATELFDESEDK